MNTKRTNIVLDDKLVEKAFNCAKNVSTKRELVNLALREFVQNHQRKDIRELRGKIKFRDDYDIRALRREEGK